MDGRGMGDGFRMIQAHYIQAHLLLCGPVLNRPRMVLICGPQVGDPYSRGSFIQQILYSMKQVQGNGLGADDPMMSKYTSRCFQRSYSPLQGLPEAQAKGTLAVEDPTLALFQLHPVQRVRSLQGQGDMPLWNFSLLCHEFAPRNLRFLFFKSSGRGTRNSMDRAWASQLECPHACGQGSSWCRMEPAVESESEWPAVQGPDIPTWLAQN